MKFRSNLNTINILYKMLSNNSTFKSPIESISAEKQKLSEINIIISECVLYLYELKWLCFSFWLLFLFLFCFILDHNLNVFLRSSIHISISNKTKQNKLKVDGIEAGRIWCRWLVSWYMIIAVVTNGLEIILKYKSNVRALTTKMTSKKK